MDTITVIFTGMMIFDVSGAMVYPVKVPNHVFTVKIGATEKTVAGVAFQNLAPGSSRFEVFPILSLPKLAGVAPLTINPSGVRAGIGVGFEGAFQGDGPHAVCSVGMDQWPTWQSVRWVVGLAKDAAISIDGVLTPLTKDMTVYIGNESTASSGASDLPMYGMGVWGPGGSTVTVRACGDIGVQVHNPITCPPVTLQ